MKIWHKVFFVFGFLVDSACADPVSYNVLDSGNLRFGNNGHASSTYTITQNSVNSYGNLNQPFYYSHNANLWYKLTYSNHPIYNRIGVGGDGVDEWNLNGTMLTNPTLVNQIIDTSNFIKTDGDKGYGTIISTGVVTIGGQQLEYTNVYELGQTNAYIKVTTKIKNMSLTTATNLRVWIGVKDDWIGNSDVPTETRGQIIDGSFVKAETSATKSPAIKISTGNEAAMFYSNSQRANTSINYCCSFENATTQNPLTSKVEETTDGSYSLFIRMNDLDQNETDEFNWFYAAGALDDLENIIADVATAANSSVVVKEDGTVDLSGVFIDSNSNNYPKVQITILPEHGTLTLYGIPVEINQEILLSDFPNLLYSPNPSYTGMDFIGWIGDTSGGSGTTWSAEARIEFTVERTLDNKVAVDSNADVNVSVKSSGVVYSSTGEYASATFHVDQSLTEEQTRALPGRLQKSILANSGVNFTISGDVNMSITLTFALNSSQKGIFTGYWKYAPQILGGENIWYDLGKIREHSDTENDGVGYEISNDGRSMTVTLIDGKLGDSDFLPNGQIVDPGFPVVSTNVDSEEYAAPTATTVSKSEKKVPLSDAVKGLMALMFLLVAFLGFRKKEKNCLVLK